MPMEIRPLEPTDCQAVCDLIPNEEELFLVYPKGKFPLTVDQLKIMLERRVDPRVLLINGNVSGFAAFYRLRKRRYVFIGNVVVDSQQRASGLGRFLMSHMIELAFGKYDLPEVRISVYSRNTPALLLYASMGFSPYAIEAKRDNKGNRVALINLSLRRKQ